jgi:hypothetical protein
MILVQSLLKGHSTKRRNKNNKYNWTKIITPDIFCNQNKKKKTKQNRTHIFRVEKVKQQDHELDWKVSLIFELQNDLQIILYSS